MSKFIIIFITAFSASTLTGCWNRRELDTLGFVTALGVDRTGESKIEITVHVAKPFAIARATESSVSPEKAFWVVSSTGSTAFEAIRNLLLQSPRRPFYAHNRFIVIGEECARAGVGDILDLFARDGEARRLARVEVVKGSTARQFLEQVEFELERLPSEGGQGISRYVQEGVSAEPVDCTLNSFLRCLEAEGVEPVAVRVEAVPKMPAAPGSVGDLLRDQVKISSKHGGAAVFKGDKLVGWLDERETRGVNWVTGKVRSGILVIDQPNEKGKLVSLEILRAPRAS
ncbi:MAG: Ger(x)C family spore germination protein [Firmicutes bacterium]|nr:Ger(x)C family spore germination protein [Candidatus Fermentithermobacillaceae bacterium]